MTKKVDSTKKARGEGTRRHKGEGTIYQRSDGKWCAQVSSGRDEHGKDYGVVLLVIHQKM